MRTKDIPLRVIHRSGLLHDIYVKTRFPTEIKLLNGTHSASSSHPSIIHFTLNRAASQFTKKLLYRCAKNIGMTTININEYARANKMQFLDRMTDEDLADYKHVFKPKGYCYSSFGGFVRGIPELHRYLIVLMVRDPRDVLTSLYFSTAFSHSLPADPSKAAKFTEARQKAREMTVDEFVLNLMGNYARRYRVYMTELDNMANVHVTKYEDMIADFPGWLYELLAFCSLPVTPSEREKIIDKVSRSQDTNENQSRHKRQVIPGDHERKLKPETISRLNSGLSDILVRYGYEREETLLSGKS